ncbi:rho GTPase-activating protein 190 isoform X1 [Megalopta genalis]|uniref:rho GTPase-activating protein 190 isoform X1 n=1 Tax=Megalopta genalis TaxID=115081 RepID=UPI001442F2D9|nr:rho GTPase-activating protein 190 isoform X1 [Megalopta genalis]XP_033341441.1 rho GTPase-activating protein 190 isoform X1 [Megalopta genalis]XP_033341442.1 rho GTPase-activating protein 190 isoform X1 [Megalopta genalis]
MARKSDNIKTINVAIVGLSGTEKDKGQIGVGKSCLCNRFMRSLNDDYNVDHISVLSQSDFSGRVVNNDHFLYWGEVMKTSEDGSEYQFQVIEHTEFIDDASFQPFKGGKMEPYAKRCAATKLTSAEKLMYICKNQLGIEKEYEQKVLPDGKLNIDGFLCVFDVSVVPNRAVEKQVEIVANILNSLMKTKKPIVLVTTKNDDANEQYVKEAEKLVMRKEYKSSILIVETSAHENINIDLAFIVLAQLIDKTKTRSKVTAFAEAARARKELLDASTESLQRLIRIHVTDYRSLWSQASKKLAQHKEFTAFVELFGIDATQRLFRRHIKKLKDEQVAKKIQGYLDMLPDTLHEICPDVTNLINEEWSAVQQYIKEHPDFHQYFYECPEDIPWIDCDFGENNGSKIPYDVLETPEAETVFKNHINVLQQEQRRLELPKRWKKQFKQLLEETGYVTPGKHLSEVRVLFMGRECFEALSHHDCQEIYDQHQKEIVEKAKHNFQELLLEHADLFYHFKSIAPSGTITQDDIKEITDALVDDFRYKALDRLDQDRKLMLFQHLGFVHCPIREHCPAYPNCMDALIERILGTKAHRPSSWNHSSQWQLTSDNNQLNLVILGSNGLGEEFAREIRAQTEDDEVEIDCQLYTLGYRIIDGDVGLPHNSFTTSDFMPHGSFCIYANEDSFEYIRSSLEKTLLSNLEQEDRLPFQGLPIVIMFVPESTIDEMEAIRLRQEGQNLADSLQCPFIDVCIEDLEQDKRFPTALVKDALQQLIQSINHRAGFLNIYQSVIECLEPDIRIIMCTFCGDPYSVENVLGPLLNHQCCFLSGDRSIVLETFLGESKRRVEVIISSFHGANAFRDELVHGFILVYSTKRKASLATLNAFSMNIPNLPIQIMAVTDTGGANAFFSNDLCHLLITEGNATADRLQAHFMTSASSCQQKTAFYTPFFKEVWEKKPEIEQAFNMEEPGNLNDSGEGTLEYSALHPMPPPRHESYHLQTPDDGMSVTFRSGSESYEQLTPDGEQFADNRATSSDDSDIYIQVDFCREERERELLKSSDIANKLSGWVKHTFIHQDGVTNNYPHRAFTTGRRYVSQLKPRPKGNSQTLKQPGKINLKDFSHVTDAIARMTIGEKDEHGPKMTMGHAPLATPELVDLGSDYAQVKDVVPSLYPSYDGDYMYALVQDSIGNNKPKLRNRREKGQFSYHDSDSERSSLENKKPAPNKRIRRKRIAIPVAAPKVPFFSNSKVSRDGIVSLNYNVKEDKNWQVDPTERVSSDAPDSSESSDPEPTSRSRSKQYKHMPPNLRKRSVNSLSQHQPTTSQHSFNVKHMAQDVFSTSSKQRSDNTFGSIQDDESSLDVPSPRETNSPSFGISNKIKDGDKLNRKKDKQKAKEDEKLEKRRQKEEKLKKHAEKEKEREKKKQEKIKQTKGPGGSLSGSQAQQQPLIEDFAQSETNRIPLFLEKCVQFIEDEGLDSEGIYRVPGNRAHVELLFQKFEEDENVDIHSLDIPVNAVATALKDFFSKRLPPLIDKERMSELEDISGARGISKPMSATCMNMEDRSCRLLALRLMLNKLNPINFDVLKFIFHHFVKVAENCKLNSMDSKNLAICWWPTLLPIEFNDLGRFEAMRPYLEDVVQTMIDQYPFLFCGEEAIVMV